MRGKKAVNLESLREKIDEIDEKILGLINDRAEKAVEIGRIKTSGRLGFHAPDRETKIIRNLKGKNKGPLPSDAVRVIFREIMSACLALQQPVKIAYLGPEATFTHLAATERFGSGADFIPVKSVGDVFLEVEKKRCDYGVVPVENSMEGMVSHTLDMFADSELKICAEISLPVNHHLLSKASVSGVRKVYSHPQAFAQCRIWLETNLPGCQLEEAASTAEAARLASVEQDAGAIASRAASEIYNLPVAAANIEDTSPNLTRFLVIGPEYSGKTGRDKTSIMFSIKDRVGALYDMLKPFKSHQINLTRIESRPSKKKAWDYFFFIDLQGHVQDAKVSAALKELEGESVMFKLLGSYPEAEN